LATLERSRRGPESVFRQTEPDAEVAAVSYGTLTVLVHVEHRKESFVERDVRQPEHGVGEEVEVVLHHLDHDPILKKIK